MSQFDKTYSLVFKAECLDDVKDLIDYDIIKIAIKEDRLDIVTYYYTTLQNDPTFFFNDAAHESAKEGKLEILRYLCESKTFIDGKRCDPTDVNNRALQDSTKYGHLDIVTYLCETDFYDNNNKDNKSKYSGVVEYLYKIGMCTNVNVDLVKYISFTDFVYGKRCDPTAKRNKAVRKAVENGHLDVVTYLCKSFFCDPSDYGNASFILAVKNNHLDTLKYICKYYQCDPSICSNIAVSYAVKNQDIEMLTYLAETEFCINNIPKRCSLSAFNNHIVKIASIHKNPKIVSYLYDVGVWKL